MYDQNEGQFDESDATRSTRAPAPAPHVPSAAAVVAIVLLAGAVVVSLGYTFSQRRQLHDLSAKQEQATNELQQSLDALAALRAKVDALGTRPAPQPAPTELADSQTAALQNPAALATQPVRKTHVRRKPRVIEDPRWAKMQKQLADQQQQLTSTEQDLETTRQELSDNLESTRDDLNGSIAKTHDELVALERKGERNYQEFDVTRSKEFQHVGPVGLELRKANTRHDFYDVTLLVDDYKLDKKHVNLYEPVWIYPEDSREPIELVVNQISRDRIHGYLSSPKYPETTRTALNAQAPGGAAASNTGASTNAAAPNAGSTPDTSASPNTGAGQSNVSPAEPKQQ